MPQCYSSCQGTRGSGVQWSQPDISLQGDLSPSSQQVTPTSVSAGQPCLCPVERVVSQRCALSPSEAELPCTPPHPQDTPPWFCVLGNGSPPWGVYHNISVLQMRNRGSEKRRNSPKVTELMQGRMQTQVSLTPGPGPINRHMDLVQRSPSLTPSWTGKSPMGDDREVCGARSAGLQRSGNESDFIPSGMWSH